MEILTYSLWFTLVWWFLTLFSTTTWGGKVIEVNDITPHYIGLPSIAILLEYLIVR